MSYKAPLTSTTNFGLLQVGSGLSVNNGVVSAGTGLLNYGFVNSSTAQTNPVANAVNSVTYDTLGPHNGVTINAGGSAIKVANAGVYTQLFTITTAKTSGGTSTITIWLRRNGVDLPGSAQDLQLTNTLSTIFTSGNYTLSLLANDEISMHWSSSDTTAGMAVLPAQINPVRPTGYSVKVTLTRIS